MSKVTLDPGYLNSLSAEMASQKSVNWSELKELMFSFSQSETELSVWNNGTASMSKSDIDIKIEELAKQIEELKELIEEETNYIIDQQRLIDVEMEKLNKAIRSVAEMVEDIEQTQLDRIATVSDDVMREYIEGKIPREKVESEIAIRLTAHGYSQLTSAALTKKLLDCDDFQKAIVDIETNITNSSSKINTYKSDITGLETLSNIYIALSKVASKNSGNNKQYGDKAPIYTAAKRDLIEKLKTQFGREVVTGDIPGDSNSASNQYTADLYKAIGSGDQNNSILKQMYDQGFTYREAMYAVSYLYGGTTNIHYNLNSNALSIPYGHGGAATWYAAFQSQVQHYWGASARINPPDEEVPDPTNPDPTNPDPTNPDPTNPDPTNPGVTPIGNDIPIDDGEPPAGPVNRTDPIGWNNGNTSYSFVTDANNDNIFNNMMEFVGARDITLSQLTNDNMFNFFNKGLLENLGIADAAELSRFDVDGDGHISGIEELFMFDTDGNGVIEDTELNNLTVLETVETKGKFSFMSASLAGAQSIDLKKFQNNGVYDASLINKSGGIDINGNMTVNTFGVTMGNGYAFNGYQRLDRTDYLDNMFQGAYAAHYTTQYKAVKDADGKTTAEIVPSTAKETPWTMNLGSQQAQELIAQAKARTAMELQLADAEQKNQIKLNTVTILDEGQQGAEIEEEQPQPDKEVDIPYGIQDLKQQLAKAAEEDKKDVEIEEEKIDAV